MSVEPPSVERVVLGHGSGGRLTADLIRQTFMPAFANDILCRLEDQATCLFPVPPEQDGVRIAFTTDSYVVRPIFFPGGDIGSMSIHGTINDLAVGGAIPRFISAAFILEEGLPFADLRRVVASMSDACSRAGVQLVTGDTKVVDRGKGDQIFITTSGIGVVPAGRSLSVSQARPGDRIIVSGTIGDHGITIMLAREGLDFQTTLQSDSAALHGLTEAVLAQAPHVRCMRDATRGGLSSVLHEICSASGVGVELHEPAIPVRPEVQAACELLGLDALYVANEGKLVAIVPPQEAEAALAALRADPLGADAAIVGTITAEHAGMVTLRSSIGGQRVVTMLSGEQLPRIC